MSLIIAYLSYLRIQGFGSLMPPWQFWQALTMTICLQSPKFLCFQVRFWSSCYKWICCWWIPSRSYTNSWYSQNIWCYYIQSKERNRCWRCLCRQRHLAGAWFCWWTGQRYEYKFPSLNLILKPIPGNLRCYKYQIFTMNLRLKPFLAIIMTIYFVS